MPHSPEPKEPTLELWLDYTRDRLNEAETLRMEAALRARPELRSEIDKFDDWNRLVSAAVRQAQPAATRSTMRPAVRARADWRWAASAVAAVCIVFLGGFFVGWRASGPAVNSVSTGRSSQQAGAAAVGRIGEKSTVADGGRPVAPEPVGKMWSSEKTAMAYHIRLLDDVPATMHTMLRSGDYHWFESTLRYTRVTNATVDRIGVAAVFEPSALSRWAARSDVHYREVVNVVPAHEPWLVHLVQRVANLHDTEQQLAELGALFSVKAKVAGRQAAPQRVHCELAGCVIDFAVSPSLAKDAQIDYEFHYVGVQPRNHKRFPVIVTEPTRTLEVVFDHSGAPSLINLRFADVLLANGSVVVPDVQHLGDKLRVTWDGRRGALEPGSALQVWWNPQPTLANDMPLAVARTAIVEQVLARSPR